MDFCIMYEVQAGDNRPEGGLSTVDVRFSELWPARKAARYAARAAADSQVLAAMRDISV
jgi:hypothetical protein